MRGAGQDGGDTQPFGKVAVAVIIGAERELANVILLRDNALLRGYVEFVGFGGEDKIAFVQSLDLVSPDLQFDLAPCQIDVRVMALLLGQFAYLVYKIQGRAKIFELVQLLKVVLFDDLPATCEFGQQRRKCVALQRLDAAGTWNTFSI